jgi:hypothetical protein
MTILLLAGCFLTSLPRRPWPEVLKDAATNYYALIALAFILGGFWFSFGTRVWRKIVGILAVLAGATLLIAVLKDIRAEIPLRRNSGQVPAITDLRA